MKQRPGPLAKFQGGEIFNPISRIHIGYLAIPGLCPPDYRFVNMSADHIVALHQECCADASGDSVDRRNKRLVEQRQRLQEVDRAVADDAIARKSVQFLDVVAVTNLSPSTSGVVLAER